MKKILVLFCLSFFAVPVLAATAQQDKMKSCNDEATLRTLKGDARKSFMKECLSAQKPDATATAEPKKEKTPQQAKMAQCNADATRQKLKGTDRRVFMGDCLKAKK